MYLNTHSYYSLRYGTMSIEKLVEKAKEIGICALSLTDINNSTGILDFVKICNKNNIKAIAGIDFRDGNKHLFTAIAKNNAGFQEINECVSEHNILKKKFPEVAPDFNNVFIIYPFGEKKARELKENEFVGIRPNEVRKLFSSDLKHRQEKLLIRQPVSFASESDFILHKNLRAIDNNILLSRLQPGQFASPKDVILSPDKLREAFEYYPKIIQNTEKLVELSGIEFDYKTPKNKQSFTGNRYDDKILLEKLALDGLQYRYGKQNTEARLRIEKELQIIDKLGFSAYFLIAWDIIRYSMSRGFYHVGRGSGANSIVAYCLKITDVDPIELDLYFERFINPKRTSPPDFDIDYSWRDRDEVQDYIFKRHGRKHTALLGATSTFKGKSIYRELGKVYGLPKNEIDDLIKYPDKEINKNIITKTIHSLAGMMLDFPNIRSIHAGGILISEKPINYYTALDMPPKGFPTTQWDMYVAEDIRFEKLDILSQRGIGHIKECSEIVLKNQKIKIDVHQVEDFKKDEKVKSLLKNGETNGCFYVESPAMRGLLKKLRCDNYLSLVAASSIIRPGVARSGMMRQYILRFHNPEFKYLHPVMEKHLKETFGVMVYQEDVLKICHHFAGLDLADADVLRRAMSGKFRAKSEFQIIVRKFFENCKNFGYPDELTKEVWRQIESFAAYSFSKAHSASYAVESFQSLYLKAHFPLEFMVAVINNFGGFYHSWVYFSEARRCGAIINLPCVNTSDFNTRIIGKDIFIGFVHISNFESKTTKSIIAERKKNGEFTGLEDFLDRIQIGIEQIIILIKSNAFRFTGITKARLLWDAHLFLGKKIKTSPSMKMFKLPTKKFVLPKLENNEIEDAYDEIELLGFPVSMSFFDLLKTKFRGELFAKDLINYIGKKVRVVGHLVTIKYVRTVKKEYMHFGTFLDYQSEFLDTVHFPQSLKKYPFRGTGVYLIYGKIVQEFGFPSIEVEKMAKLPIQPDPRNK